MSVYLDFMRRSHREHQFPLSIPWCSLEITANFDYARAARSIASSKESSRVAC